jgi:hypothetical protein
MVRDAPRFSAPRARLRDDAGASSRVRSCLALAGAILLAAGFERAGPTGAPSFLVGRAHGALRVAMGDYFRPHVIEGAIQRALRNR